MSRPTPQQNDELAVQGHWLGGDFRVNELRKIYIM
jgi:hypothetical protein